MYCFGSESDVSSTSVAVQTPLSHIQHHITSREAHPHEANGASHREAKAQESTVAQLDTLLHVAPKLANGARKQSFHGISNTRGGLLELAQTQDSQVAVLTHGHAPPSDNSHSPKQTLETVDYTVDGAGSVVRLYVSLCDKGKLDDALTVVKGSIRAGRDDVLSRLKHYKFLRAAQRQRAVRSALRFMQLFPRQYVDARTYNMLISVCAEVGDVKNALRAADMLRAAGLRMDTILYTNLIKVCASAGDAEAAFRLYSEMKAAGVKREKQVYTTLVSACAEQIGATHATDRRTQLVLLERAFALVDTMESSRIQLDPPLWNALVTAAGRAGQLQRAFDVLEQMMSRGVRPNARTYASLIDACARNSDKDLALRVYHKALREGCSDELVIYSAAVNACVKSRTGADVSSAMEIYADLQRAGVTPDSAFYGALMTAAGRAGDLDLTLDLQAEMTREGLRPCSGTESALITVQVLQGRLSEAAGIYRRMQKAGVVPHQHAMNAMINAHAKELRLGDVVSLVCDMVEAGTEPDGFTLAAVLSACRRCDEAELALDVYRVMRMRGMVIEEIHVRLLIQICYSRLRQSWESAAQPSPRTALPITVHAGTGHRAQERAKLLAALVPSGRTPPGPIAPNGEIRWQAHAFHMYREAVATGLKPSLKLLNIMLACLRVPWSRAVRGDKMEDLAEQTQRLHAGLPPTAGSGSTLVQGKIGVESVYHVQAISILEEAIVGGQVPAFTVDSQPPFDLRAMPPSVAEVYMLTVVSALQRQIEARRELKNRIVFLVPRYDGNRVFRPSFLSDEEDDMKDDASAALNQSSSGGSLDEASMDALADIFDGDEDEYELSAATLRNPGDSCADERTGLGVAGTLRRLRLWAREYSPEGLIVIEPKQFTRWAKMIQKEIERRSASALALQKPYGQSKSVMGGGMIGMGGASGILRQASSIRAQGL